MHCFTLAASGRWLPEMAGRRPGWARLQPLVTDVLGLASNQASPRPSGRVQVYADAWSPYVRRGESRHGLAAVADVAPVHLLARPEGALDEIGANSAAGSATVVFRQRFLRLTSRPA